MLLYTLKMFVHTFSDDFKDNKIAYLWGDEGAGKAYSPRASVLAKVEPRICVRHTKLIFGLGTRVC